MKQVIRSLANMLSLPLYPFLFSIYPILFIYSNNLNDVFLREIISPIFISLGTTIFVFFTLKFIIKDINKAAIITTAVLIIFFSYGHIFGLIENFKIGGVILGRNRYLLPTSLILLFLVSSITIKTKSNIGKISKILNLIISVLILVSLGTVGNYALAHGLSVSKRVEDKVSEQSTKKKNSSKLPDIYYIILDGYARQSTLKTIHKFDNSEFINYLKDEGFYVASKSRSNYSITHVSLTSSLNMRYLDDIKKSQIDEAKVKVASFLSGISNSFSKPNKMESASV